MAGLIEVNADQKPEGRDGETVALGTPTGDDTLDLHEGAENFGDTWKEPGQTPAPGGTPTPQTPAPGTPAPVVAPSADEGLIPDIAPPATPEPAKPAEAPGFDGKAFEDETTATAKTMQDPKMRNAFIKERAAHKQDLEKASAAAAKLQERLTELEKKVQGAPGQVPAEVQAKVTELERQLQEYEDKLGRADFTQTRGFNEKFVQPLMESQTKMLRMLVQNGGLAADEAKQALNALLRTRNPKEQSAMLSDLPVPVQGAMLSALDEFSERLTRRDTAVQNWREQRAAMTETEKRTQQLEFSKELSQGIKAAIDELSGSGNVFFRHIEGNTDWNAKVDQRISAVSGLLQSGNIAALARTIAEGVAFADLNSNYVKLRNAYTKLKSDAARMVPGFASIREAQRADGVEAPSKPEVPKNASDEQIIAQTWK